MDIPLLRIYQREVHRLDFRQKEKMSEESQSKRSQKMFDVLADEFDSILERRCDELDLCGGQDTGREYVPKGINIAKCRKQNS